MHPNGTKRARLEQLMKKFVLRSRVIIFRNETSRSTQMDPKLMFWCVLSVWVHLGPFRYCKILAAKHAKLVQLIPKFVPRSRVGIFRNDAPDPHHWTLNSCFGVFRTIWVQLGRIGFLTNLGGKRAELV